MRGCRRWLTCWSWPGSASLWRWEWACGTWVRPGIPALGWTGRETWWPGTWSEGRGRSWWGCRPDPLFLARRISLSKRRRLLLAPGEICWNQKVILLSTVREKTQHQLGILQGQATKTDGKLSDCNLPRMRMCLWKLLRNLSTLVFADFFYWLFDFKET